MSLSGSSDSRWSSCATSRFAIWSSARARQIGGDPRHLGGDPVERVPEPKVLAELLRAPVGKNLLDERLDLLLALVARLLADELRHLLVGDHEPELVRRSLERQLTRE